MPELKPVAVPSRKPYIAVLSPLERRAYHAAYRILTEEDNGMDSVTHGAAGGRRSARLDAIAKTIVEEIGPLIP